MARRNTESETESQIVSLLTEIRDMVILAGLNGETLGGAARAHQALHDLAEKYDLLPPLRLD
ncbi:MAG: hypothetical protein Q7S58_00980 [Candidatus Binatus sp.]|uniref:hypothetical protein n=1 Tax=Candidatus Binatus sp. TaxID=2811406 RepID=UPI00271E03F5|nr:hypothetical protein [Candidatus Binatus sp.]MDO8430961.1 hypothetical protein [Candidatus Binatus sp.]